MAWQKKSTRKRRRRRRRRRRTSWSSYSFVLLEVCKCLRSRDGQAASLNPLGRLLTGPGDPPWSGSGRLTRAVQAGDLPPPLRKSDNTFVWLAHKLYNEVTCLRTAPTLAAAARIADSFVSTIPIWPPSPPVTSSLMPRPRCTRCTQLWSYAPDAGWSRPPS